MPLRINYHFEQEVVQLAIPLPADQAIQVPQPVAEATPAPEVNADIPVAPGTQQEVTIVSFCFIFPYVRFSCYSRTLRSLRRRASCGAPEQKLIHGNFFFVPDSVEHIILKAGA